MDGNKKAKVVSSQESGLRRAKPREIRNEKFAARIPTRKVFILAIGYWLLATIAQAQTVNLGGTGALGKFINPTSVVTNTGGQTCGYNEIRIDLAQGKVFAIPNRTTSNTLCSDQSPVDITNVVDATTGQKPFAIAPTGPITNGVLEVTDFVLQTAFGPSTFIDGILGFGSNITHLTFVSNSDNTPVWIRATGNVTINGNTVLNVAGRNGGNVLATFLRGTGGNGGPGGFRGGDGGNGGISPSIGTTGFGPGGAAGAAADTHATVSAKFLTTGKTVAGTAIAAGNDLLTMLRGGSGGGGGGGRSSFAGGGAGGGGGAVLIAANGTITVSGTVTAEGGNGSNSSGRNGSGGSGGAIRVVANTIAGGGVISATGGAAGSCTIASPCPVVGEGGFLRLEAFTISFSGSFGGFGAPQATNVTAASAPGQIFLPTSATASAFLKISKITDGANPSNTVSPSLAAQDIAGRTGIVSSVDATMPNPASPANTVAVEFTVGPCPGFPAGKNITLVVTPLDPAQGAAANYTTASPIDCTASPHATISGVTLPLGFSSFSAFTVLSIDTGGVLARMFPKIYQGEEIDSVRIEANARGTEYVLIAKSGKEFPYKQQ
ncbi:MAG: hypothetical protein HY649_05020 [Acidobacteria bacterium]|nr:hypothetical protein [Acidobacteriota bacterium]